jgi:formiminotetrahydrofolate cyclodeaminase
MEVGMNSLLDQSCREFADVLASAEPVPGGGGASALVGALGAALGSMVGNLTLGKKKYEAVQEDIRRVLSKMEALRAELLSLADRDAEVFKPLSEAYGLPKDTEEQRVERDAVMEAALKRASGVPLEIMEKVMDALKLHEELAAKGTRIAISDVGVGALFCRAALAGAALNVSINPKLMKDRAFADALNKRAEEMLEKGLPQAERIYRGVAESLK